MLGINQLLIEEHDSMAIGAAAAGGGPGTASGTLPVPKREKTRRKPGLFPNFPYSAQVASGVTAPALPLLCDDA